MRLPPAVLASMLRDKLGLLLVKGLAALRDRLRVIPMVKVGVSGQLSDDYLGAGAD